MTMFWNAVVWIVLLMAVAVLFLVVPMMVYWARPQGQRTDRGQLDNSSRLQRQR